MKAVKSNAYPGDFRPAKTSTPPITIAATPTIGVTIPRSCDVTLRGPTSTSFLLFVYGMPRIATMTSPATMSNTPIQASGRMTYSIIKVTNAAPLVVGSQAGEGANHRDFIAPEAVSWHLRPAVQLDPFLPRRTRCFLVLRNRRRTSVEPRTRFHRLSSLAPKLGLSAHTHAIRPRI